MPEVHSNVEAGTPTMPANGVPPPSRPQVVVEHRVRINDLSWKEYKLIADAIGERHHHLSYDGWSLELMVKSSTHCRASRILMQMVLALTEELGLPRCSCGGMTCQREDVQRAIEPDECFYIANAARVLGRDPIDLAVDPPPDLAVEVDLTTDSRRRLGIYAALGVREIWRFTGADVFIHVRGEDGTYSTVEHSPTFSFVAGADLARFLEQRTQTDENSLFREFRTWVRQQIAQ